MKFFSRLNLLRLTRCQQRRRFHNFGSLSVPQTLSNSEFVSQSDLCTFSVQSPHKFWTQYSEKLRWLEPYDPVLSSGKRPLGQSFFRNGKLNATDCCIDLHIDNGHGDRTAFIWESPLSNRKGSITYTELRKKVISFASGMKDAYGVQVGDVVLIQMPTSVETAITMLACARLGAIHTTVFGGLGVETLADRIRHAEPKVIVTASIGLEPQKRINYLDRIQQALNMVDVPIPCIVFDDINQIESFFNDSQSALHSEAVPFDHPLYISYTSGTTANPKGVVRSHGGQCVSGLYAFESFYQCTSADVFFCAAHIAWVLGHSCAVYGSLLSGATSVLYDGKPVGTPDSGVLWRICSEYDVKCMFTSVSALRTLRKVDPAGSFAHTHDLGRLEALYIAGEPTDVSTYEWISNILKEVSIIDNYWQTETGFPITGTMRSEVRFPRSGTCGAPLPGWDIRLLDFKSQPITECNRKGHVVARLPLPPGSFTGLWKVDCQPYYFRKFPGYYDTGDIGYFTDEDKNLRLIGRSDDDINVSGHRLCLASMVHAVVTSDNSIVDAVIVGAKHPIKGQVPVGFLVVENNCSNKETVVKNAIESVMKSVGPVSCFRNCYIVSKLPRTKSGKPLLRTIASIVNKEKFKVPDSIDDIESIKEIEQAVKKMDI